MRCVRERLAEQRARAEAWIDYMDPKPPAQVQPKPPAQVQLKPTVQLQLVQPKPPVQIVQPSPQAQAPSSFPARPPVQAPAVQAVAAQQVEVKQAPVKQAADDTDKDEIEDDGIQMVQVVPAAAVPVPVAPPRPPQLSNSTKAATRPCAKSGVCGVAMQVAEDETDSDTIPSDEDEEIPFEFDAKSCEFIRIDDKHKRLIKKRRFMILGPSWMNSHGFPYNEADNNKADRGSLTTQMKQVENGIIRLDCKKPEEKATIQWLRTKLPEDVGLHASRINLYDADATKQFMEERYGNASASGGGSSSSASSASYSTPHSGKKRKMIIEDEEEDGGEKESGDTEKSEEPLGDNNTSQEHLADEAKREHGYTMFLAGTADLYVKCRLTNNVVVCAATLARKPSTGRLDDFFIESVRAEKATLESDIFPLWFKQWNIEEVCRNAINLE